MLKNQETSLLLNANNNNQPAAKKSPSVQETTREIINISKQVQVNPLMYSFVTFEGKLTLLKQAVDNKLIKNKLKFKNLFLFYYFLMN